MKQDITEYVNKCLTSQTVTANWRVTTIINSHLELELHLNGFCNRFTNNDIKEKFHLGDSGLIHKVRPLCGNS